jgi:hypothetical protein
MIFHDFEEHSGNYVTKNQGKSDRCPAFAENQTAVPLLQPIQPESDRLLVRDKAKSGEKAQFIRNK